MAILVSEIIKRLNDLLVDESNTRWPVPELIRWVNDSAGAILNRRASAYAKLITHSLVSGAVQAIPVEGAQLLDIVRNIKPDGGPGRPISMADRKMIEDADPDWYAMRTVPSIQQYTHDPRAPKVFYVYPPAQAGVKVEMLYSALPNKLEERADKDSILNTDVFDTPAEFMESIINFVMYRAFSKDSEYADAKMATGYYAAFQDSIGSQAQGVQASAPESASI